MNLQVFHNPVWFRVGGVPVTEAAVLSLAIAGALVLAAALLRRTAVRRAESLGAALAELAVDWFDQLATDVIGRPEPWVVTFAGSLFLFIAGCNVAGQFPGVRSPMANLSTTTALAVIVFLAVPAAGIRAHGVWGYVRHYFLPNPLFMPLHVLSEISRTVALSVRLFGNMMSGHLIVALLVSLAGFLIPMPLMALDLLIGLLQAYIFTVLSTVYIGAAVRVGEAS